MVVILTVTQLGQKTTQQNPERQIYVCIFFGIKSYKEASSEIKAYCSKYNKY